MNRILIVALAAGALALPLASGCKDNKATEPPAQPAQPVATVAPPPPAAQPAPVAASGKMAHCPSTVTGAGTAIADTKDGVDITITAKDDAATKEIRARAAFLVNAAKNDMGSAHHNGTGEGGGIFGRCPIVMRNTTVVVADVEGGSKVTVAPRDAKEQDWLRRESRTRLADLAPPGQDGAGANKMAHCPNAVHGALTSVADQKDGVTVTVTAKSDDAVKEIRDRAQKIVAAAKASTPAAAPKHDGSGTGGGGLGRCPIVLKDTDVVEKDTPNGAVFTVKPKKGGDLKALDKEIRDRSAKFAAL